jgi:hypothetical protein
MLNADPRWARAPIADRGCWCDEFDSAPAMIALPMLGMLGGSCGEPVSLLAIDYPPEVVCAVQRFLLTHLRDGQVLEIFGRSDLSRLVQADGDEIVLVIVDPHRARSSVGQGVLWSIARRRGGRSPAVLLASESGLADSPAAMLAIRRSTDDLARIQDWLLRHSSPDPRIGAYFTRSAGSTFTVDFARLAAVIAPGDGPAIWQARSVRSLETLRGLLAGSALLRRILASSDACQEIVPSGEDYGRVYSLLQGPAVGVPEEAGDHLLVAMVRRANLYLERAPYLEEAARRACGKGFKQGREGFESRMIPRSYRASERDRGISRRELADLGNVRSELLKSLIDDVVKSEQIGRIRSMGLVRDLAEERCRQGIGQEELRSMLVHWTMKQVITRFHKLCRQGFIESERMPSNGPLVYQLPDELKGLPPEFKGLPSPEEVERLITGPLTG